MKIENDMLQTGISVKNTATVKELANFLHDNKLRRAFVVDAEQKPVGVVSTTDISFHVVVEGKDASQAKVEDIMTKGILIVEKVDTIESVSIEMDKLHVPSAVVVESGKMVGVLTQEECMKNLLHMLTNGGGKK